MRAGLLWRLSRCLHAIQDIIERSESLQRGIEPITSDLLKLKARVDEIVERILELELRNARKYVVKQRSQQTWETVEECVEEITTIFEEHKTGFLNLGMRFLNRSSFSRDVKTACARYLFLQGLSPEVQAVIGQMGVDVGRRHTDSGETALEQHRRVCHSQARFSLCDY